MVQSGRKAREGETPYEVITVVCTWLLGGGASQVIELCQKLGVTMINLDPDGKTVRIYQLDDEDPRLFT